MPKPFDHLPCNGLHIHLSLWDNNNKEISCSKNNEFPLSELGSHFVSGILNNAHSLTATGCASVNSYKRIVPGSWSPAHICWGNENRSTLIRITGKENRKHIELRHGDNANNPYIYVNTVLASGLEGIKNKLTKILPNMYPNANCRNVQSPLYAIPGTLIKVNTEVSVATIENIAVGQDTFFLAKKKSSKDLFQMF